MSKLLFDFRCANGHVHEELVPSTWLSVPCECGLPANRIISPVRSRLDGISGDFPTASDQWEKRRESHMKQERRNQERHGTYE